MLQGRYSAASEGIVIVMKIRYMAMSGAGACEEELMRLRLTLPGFVERNKAIAAVIARIRFSILKQVHMFYTDPGMPIVSRSR